MRHDRGGLRLDELLDELLEHIAAAHETGKAREPAALLTDSYDLTDRASLRPHD